MTHSASKQHLRIPPHALHSLQFGIKQKLTEKILPVFMFSFQTAKHQHQFALPPSVALWRRTEKEREPQLSSLSALFYFISIAVVAGWKEEEERESVVCASSNSGKSPSSLCLSHIPSKERGWEAGFRLGGCYCCCCCCCPPPPPSFPVKEKAGRRRRRRRALFSRGGLVAETPHER